MARKKKSRNRAFFSRIRTRARRVSHRPLNMKGLVVGSLVYGAVRARLSNALTPVTSRIPLGNIADEVALGGLSWFVGMKVRQPLIRDISRAAFTVEMARIGEAMATGQIGLGSSTSATGPRMLF